MEVIITQNGVILGPDGNNLQINANDSVYEVIRIIDGTPLFLEDHFKRLISSLQMSGLQLEMEYSEFYQHIMHLTKLNQQQNCNVKFIISQVDGLYQWTFSLIPHSYPTSNDYQKGVATGFLFAKRANPRAKVIQNTIRDRANQLMKEKQLYEVLLVDKNTFILEGSRSNVFFVEENRFYTASISYILGGITRDKVMKCIDDMHLQIIELPAHIAELNDYDAVFLTGTSLKVLPVNCIDDYEFAVNNPYVAQVMERYDAMVEAYLKSHRQK